MDQSPKIYALLVGINQYPLPVKPLRGSLNDVLTLEDYLFVAFPSQSLHIKKLLDQQACRENVIAEFRNHLGQAGRDDLVWFHFSGHGSRQKSARELTQAGLSPDGMDETLLCYDSRTEGGRDLADKELALLLEELGETEARIIATFDCCHSGNITREDGSSLPDPAQLIPRKWESRLDRMPLENYLEGQYSEMEVLHVPEPQHLALSACRRDEKAFEVDKQGLFTKYLIDALDKLGGDPGIRELYHCLRLHFAHRFASSPYQQTPCIEAYGGFEITSRLFSGLRASALIRKKIFHEKGTWWVSLGAMDGIQSGIETDITDHHQIEIGKAKVTAVWPEKSCLNLEFSPTNGPLFAQFTNAIPETVYIFSELPAPQNQEIFDFISENTSITVENCERNLAEYLLIKHDRKVTLCRNNPYTELRTESIANPTLPDIATEFLAKYVRWRRSKLIQGKGIPANLIKFYFSSHLDRKELSGSHLHLQINYPHEQKKVLLVAENTGPEPLYFTLLYFSRECGIRAFPPIPALPQSGPVVLYGLARNQYFYLPTKYSLNTDHLRLLVSREEPDWTLIGQDGIGPEQVSRAMAPEKQLVNADDWVMLDLWLGLEAGQSQLK
jgi:hypothetical protein